MPAAASTSPTLSTDDRSRSPPLAVGGGHESSFEDEFVSLGRLKDNQGDQNCDPASDVELTPFTTVVIWCNRFNSAFGAAELTTL